MREVEGQFGLGDGVAHAGSSWCPGECGSEGENIHCVVGAAGTDRQ